MIALKIYGLGVLITLIYFVGGVILSGRKFSDVIWGRIAARALVWPIMPICLLIALILRIVISLLQVFEDATKPIMKKGDKA